MGGIKKIYHMNMAGVTSLKSGKSEKGGRKSDLKGKGSGSVSGRPSSGVSVGGSVGGGKGKNGGNGKKK